MVRPATLPTQTHAIRGTAHVFQTCLIWRALSVAYAYHLTRNTFVFARLCLRADIATAAANAIAT